MTRRDRVWRGTGAAMLGVAWTAAEMDIGGAAAGLGYFMAAIAGITLVVNGRRVPVVLRAAYRGRVATAEAIHAARMRRQTARGGRTPG